MADAQREEIAKLESLLAANPEGRIFTHLAEAYRKAGELDRAVGVLETGLRRHADYSSAHVVMGRVRLDRGERDAARDAFQRVLELDPHNLVALRALGDLARQDGDASGARDHYEKLLQVEPGNEEVAGLVAELDSAPSAAAPLEEEALPPAAAQQPAPAGELLEPMDLPLGDEGASLEADHGGEESGREFASFGGGLDLNFGEVALGDPEPAAAEQDSPPFSLGGFEPAGDAAAEAGEDREAEAADLHPGEGADAAAEEEPASQPEAHLPEHRAEGELVTETMGDLYAQQGLTARAIEVYRRLLESRPGDAGLEAKLARLSSSEPETDVDAAASAAPAPDLATEEQLQERALETLQPDATVASSMAGYFEELFGESEPSTTPPPGTAPAPSGDAFTDGFFAAGDDFEPLPPAPPAPGTPQDPWNEPEVAGWQPASLSGIGESGAHGSDRQEAAAGDESAEDRPELDYIDSAWMGAHTASSNDPTPYAWRDDPGDAADGGDPLPDYFQRLLSWRPARASTVAAEAAAESAPEYVASRPPEPERADPSAVAPQSAGEDEIDALFGAPAAPAPAQGASREPAAPPAAPDRAAAAPAAEDDEEDLEMFRSWLQSLKH